MKCTTEQKEHLALCKIIQKTCKTMSVSLKFTALHDCKLSSVIPRTVAHYSIYSIRNVVGMHTPRTAYLALYSEQVEDLYTRWKQGRRSCEDGDILNGTYRSMYRKSRLARLYVKNARDLLSRRGPYIDHFLRGDTRLSVRCLTKRIFRQFHTNVDYSINLLVELASKEDSTPADGHPITIE